jgi:hypothetical protein
MRLDLSCAAWSLNRRQFELWLWWVWLFLVFASGKKPKLQSVAPKMTAKSKPRRPALWLSMPNARLAAQQPRQRVKGGLAGGNRRKSVRRVSLAMRKRLAEYQRVRVDYLRAHLTCEVCRLEPSTQVHHRKGRGKLLSEARWFLACCFICHRKIHDQPAWAYRNEYLIKRTP